MMDLQKKKKKNSFLIFLTIKRRWVTTEELIWGDEAHPWVRPGRLFTAGPGGYKIPAFNDTPQQFNVRLLSGVGNKVPLLE